MSQAHLATGSESFVIVANGEHLSMSPAGAALPPGWHVVSEPRSKTACLDHIGTVCSGFNRPPSVPPLAPGSNLTH